MSNPRFFSPKKLGILCLLLALSVAPVRAADSSTTVAAPAETTGTNDTLRALLALQEELHETQLVIEKNRLEAERSRLEAQNANVQGSAAMSNRLAAIEQSVLAQHASEVDALRSTNRLLLAVIGIFAAIGFVAALFTAYFQLRAVNRLTDISTAISAGRALGLPPAATAGLSENAAAALANGSVEQANSRLIGLVQHLEKRVIELEQTTALPLKESSNGHGEPQGHPELALDSTPSEKTAQVGRLLERGQSLLSEQPEDAVRAFNEVLAIQPNHAEALVKKGTALEKMRQPQEALECYDRAIAADSSLTIAYLHKGGLCSRLEKYGEAMECYERALHTQEKKRAA